MTDETRPAAEGDRSTLHEIHTADQAGAAVRCWVRCSCCGKLFEVERGPDGKMRVVPLKGRDVAGETEPSSQDGGSR